MNHNLAVWQIAYQHGTMISIQSDSVGKLLYQTQIKRDFVVLPSENGGFAGSIKGEKNQSYRWHKVQVGL